MTTGGGTAPAGTAPAGTAPAGTARPAERPGPIRVVVVDDQTIVREGLSTVLSLLPDVEVVGQAADGAQAVEVVDGCQPDVVLMDLRMPVLGGADATRRIRAVAPACAVLVLTTYADDDSILDALSAGALGYLTKDASASQIAHAVRTVRAGQALLDVDVHRRLVEAAARGSGAASGTGAGSVPAAPAPVTPAPVAPAPPASAVPPDGLTQREAEILRLVAGGRSNREIAAELFVSEATVKTHLNHAYAKARVRDRAQAVAYAYRTGLVDR